MLTYVKELKQAYQAAKLSDSQYVRELLCKFYDKAIDKPGYQICGIKALLVLTKRKGRDSSIEKKEIQKQAQFPINYPHCGMWGSVQAGIVEKLKAPERYRIVPQFYKNLEATITRY